MIAGWTVTRTVHGHWPGSTVHGRLAGQSTGQWPGRTVYSRLAVQSTVAWLDSPRSPGWTVHGPLAWPEDTSRELRMYTSLPGASRVSAFRESVPIGRPVSGAAGQSEPANVGATLDQYGAEQALRDHSCAGTARTGHLQT